MKDKPSFLVWTDIETTGIQIKDNYLLEVAMAITKWDFEVIEYATYTVAPDAETDAWVGVMEEFVYNMHMDNGLIEDILKGDSLAASEVDGKLHDMLAAHGDLGLAMMAGSGVDRFDRPWIEATLPATFGQFHYRGVDLSSIRSFLAGVGLPHVLPSASDTDTKTHRALDDVMQAIEEAKGLAFVLNEMAAPMYAMENGVITQTSIEAGTATTEKIKEN